MPDYQKSKIYKLWSPSKNLVINDKKFIIKILNYLLFLLTK
jgi:hypothetical protein